MALSQNVLKNWTVVTQALKYVEIRLELTSATFNAVMVSATTFDHGLAMVWEKYCKNPKVEILPN